MATVKERQQAMSILRAEVKARKITYRSIAQSSGNSPSWIGVVLRGGYPYVGGNMLPKNIRLALQRNGLNVPEILWTF